MKNTIRIIVLITLFTIGNVNSQIREWNFDVLEYSEKQSSEYIVKETYKVCSIQLNETRAKVFVISLKFKNNIYVQHFKVVKYEYIDKLHVFLLSDYKGFKTPITLVVNKNAAIFEYDYETRRKTLRND